jgi:hypothetical protein
MGCGASSTANAVDPPQQVISTGGSKKVEITNPLSAIPSINLPVPVPSSVSQSSVTTLAPLSPSSTKSLPTQPIESNNTVMTTPVQEKNISSESNSTSTPTSRTILELSPKKSIISDSNSPSSLSTSPTPPVTSVTPVVTSETVKPETSLSNSNHINSEKETSPEKKEEVPNVITENTSNATTTSIKSEAINDDSATLNPVLFTQVQYELEKVRETQEIISDQLREIQEIVSNEEHIELEFHDQVLFEDVVNNDEIQLPKNYIAEGDIRQGEKEEQKSTITEIVAMSAAMVELMELEEAAGEDLEEDEEKVKETTLSSSSTTHSQMTVLQTSVLAATPPPPPPVPIPTTVSSLPSPSKSEQQHISTGASKSIENNTEIQTSTPRKISIQTNQELASPISQPSLSSFESVHAAPSSPLSSLSSSSSSLTALKTIGSVSPNTASRAEAVLKALSGRQPMPAEVKTAVDRSHALSTVHFMRFGRGDKAFLEGQLQIVIDSLSSSFASSPDAISAVYNLNGLPEIFVGLVIAQAFKHLAIEIATLVATGKATYENSIPFAFIDLQQRIADQKSAAQACHAAEKGAVNCMISVFPYSLGTGVEKSGDASKQPKTLQTQLIADMSRKLQDVKTEANATDYIKYRDILMTMVTNCSNSYESRVVKTSPEPTSVLMRSNLVNQIIELATISPESDTPSSPSYRLPTSYLTLLKTSTRSALTSVLMCFALDHTESRRSIVHKTMASLFNKGTGLCINIVGERVVNVWKNQVEAKVNMGVSALTRQTATKIPIDNIEIERIVKNIRTDLESFEAQQIETLHPIKLSIQAEEELILAFPDGQKLLAQLRSIIAEAIRTKLERAASSARATFQLHVDNSPVKLVGLKK